MQSELAGSASQVAPRLLGSWLERDDGSTFSRLKIVEVEAYDQTDLASHSYRGLSLRNQVMFGPAGYLYVYFTYGMHYCCNVVCGPAGSGAAILIRAAEPLDGIAALQQHRPGQPLANLCNGPAKLCQALALGQAFNGHDLRQPPLILRLQPALARQDIMQTTRIGISRAVELPWRFYIKDNPYVSVRAKNCV